MKYIPESSALLDAIENDRVLDKASYTKEAFNFYKTFILKTDFPISKNEIDLFYKGLINNFDFIKNDIVTEEEYVENYNSHIPVMENILNNANILIGNKDILSSEEYKRHTGEFYTPKPLVKIAHSMLSESLGKDWKEQFYVMDPACGTGNLTKSYKFKDLLLHTLEREDLNISISTQNDNTNIIWEDFGDFLGLSYDFYKNNFFDKKTRLVFIANPPYCSVSNVKKEDKITNKRLSNLHVEKQMKKNGVHGTKEIYIQFLYAMVEILDKCSNDSAMAIFTKTSFLRTRAYRNFIEFLTSKMYMDSAVLFPSGVFNGTSNKWAGMFSIWKKGKQSKRQWDIPYLTQEGDKLQYGGTKTIYCSDHTPDSNFKYDIKGNGEVSNFRFTTFVNYKDNTSKRVRHYNGAIGYYSSNYNLSMDQNASCMVHSAPFSHSLPLMKGGEREFAQYQIVHNCIRPNWLNEKDYILKPNTKHAEYERHLDDCIALMPFCRLSHFSAWRNIMSMDIVNHWCIADRKSILSVAKDCKYNKLINDCELQINNRYMLDIYDNLKCSDDAREMLSLARKLILDTVQFREEYDLKTLDKYQLHCWDAGWKQVVELIEEKDYNGFAKWKKLYTNVYTRLKNNIYTLGYLHK